MIRRNHIKYLIATLFFLCRTYGSNAQNITNSAQQNVSVGLSNVIAIGFQNTGTNMGSIVSMDFDDMNDYVNGVESNNQTLIVQSNKRFDVKVKTAASKFSYTGNAVSIPNMYVSNVLSIKITDNNTGGSIANGYNSYKNLSTTSKKIISNGNAGDNQTFAIKYKAAPGFNYPAGTYAVDVIFTVTQR